MKKLFILASAIVATSVVYSADDSFVVIVKTLIQRPDGINSLGEEFTVPLSLHPKTGDTMGTLADKIETHMGSKYVVLKLIYKGQDLAGKPDTKVTDLNMNMQNKPVFAIMQRNEDHESYYIKGD